jgi:hypothetical protein
VFVLLYVGSGFAIELIITVQGVLPPVCKIHSCRHCDEKQARGRYEKKKKEKKEKK